MKLIPRDHWEHNILDLLESIFAVICSRHNLRSYSLPDIGEGLLVGSGRSSLYIAIKALDLPAGSRIGVPLYCCHVVFEAISMANCIPVFLDVDPETFCISPDDLSSKCSELDAIVAVHMFGNVSDILLLKEVSNNLPIIEDCAQSIGSKYHDLFVGSLGDISFFSFRSAKYLSIGEGSAIFSKNSLFFDRIKNLIKNIRKPTLREEIFHSFKIYLKSILRSRQFYGILGRHIWSRYNKSKKLSTNSCFPLNQMFETDFSILNKRFKTLDHKISIHRKNAKYYTKYLNFTPEMLCHEKKGLFYNRYYFPITFSCQYHRDNMSKFLLKKGIDTIKYSDDVVSIASKYFGYSGGCDISERLSKNVLIIPNYSALRNSDIQYICSCLNEGWDSIRHKNSIHCFSSAI